MTKLRTVLVGAGKVGVTFADDPVMAKHYRYASHAQVLAEHPSLEWGAAVDVDDAPLAKVRERWGVTRTGKTVKEACRDYAPELAILATPPGERFEAIEDLPSLRAVIVEKPLGTTEAESRKFLAACRARNILVQVNLWRRADDRMRDIAARRDELVGKVQAAFGVYGNGLHNNGTHMIDLVRMLLGEVEHVQSAPESLRDAHGPIPGDVHVATMLTLGSGLVVHLTGLDFREYRENGLDIWGTTARLGIFQEGIGITVSPRTANRGMQGEREIASDAPAPLEPTAGTAFYRVYDNVMAALAGKEPLFSTGESALQTTRVVGLVEQSARDGGLRLAVRGEP